MTSYTCCGLNAPAPCAASRPFGTRLLPIDGSAEQFGVGDGNSARLADIWQDKTSQSVTILKRSGRTGLRWAALAALAACLGCSPRPSPPAFQPTATVKDIMDSVVDPSADAIWDSVEIIATLEGTEKKEPRTDDDWKTIRRHAIALVEASNLLLIPGRRIAEAGEIADDPRVDLHPEEIEARVTGDPATWTTRAHGLHDAALESLAAIDRRDVAALLDAGDVLDQACESCHRTYWYRDNPGAFVPETAAADVPASPAAEMTDGASATTGAVEASNGTTGAIDGHVMLDGPAPGNPVIRMGMDPKCVEIAGGAQVLQQEAVVAPDGGVANAFVRLVGDFPETPVPAEPVVVDQRGCLYGPRVLGMRVGQPLRIVNSDDLLHNVHSSSSAGNSFNVGQPTAGSAYEFTPAHEETMMRVGCDVHHWMTAWVGVVTHPYFAVSDADGRFRIANVPPGTYTIVSWHERFGEVRETVEVKAGAVTTVTFSYAGRS